MRHATKLLTASVALALAHATLAATVTPAPAGKLAAASRGPTTISAVTTPAGASASVPSSITINQPANVQPRAVENVTTVDVRNQQTLAATAGTRSSGSTSSLGPLANNGATSVNGTTSGTGATGTTSGSTTGNGTTTTTTSNTTVPFITAAGTPFLVNPSDATAGAFASNASVLPLASNGTIGSSDVYSAPLLASNGIVVTEDQLNARVNSSNVNRAIAQVQSDRKRIGRNGQLLYTIAPRTNVDRSHEMPDDGPSPTLSGYNSALAR